MQRLNLDPFYNLWQYIFAGNVPEDHYSKGILFKDGGHVPHLKESHIPVLVKEILALYKHTEKKQTWQECDSV